MKAARRLGAPPRLEGRRRLRTFLLSGRMLAVFPVFLAFFSLLALLDLSLPAVCRSATYYVNAAAPDDNGNGSESSPKKYISSGIRLMTGGDTLILEDGVYTGNANVMTVNGYQGRVFPPSGLDINHFTTLRARHPGQAIIDGEYLRTPFVNINQNTPYASYLHLDGIHFRRGAGTRDPTGSGVFGIKGSYIYISNCGFEDGGATTDTDQYPIAYIAGGSDHVLFEDCWAWGRGRYGIYFQSSSGGVTNSIIRRCVVRQDSSGQGPQAGIMFYNGVNNTVENCIVANGLITPTSADVYGAFAMTDNNGLGIVNNRILGSIGLANTLFSGFYPQGSLVGQTNTVDNTVLWDNASAYPATGSPHGFLISHTDKGTYNATHVLSGSNRGSGFRSNTGYTGKIVVLDSISTGNGSYGFESISSATDVAVFGNTAGATDGSTTFLGLRLTGNPLTSSLKYLTRIEKGSPLSGAAGDGTDIGANILYQLGGTGTFYGDAGWNTPSTTPLWPLANEAMWAAKLKAYSASGPGGNRGFAALPGPSPLTDYVWGYLGNTVPPLALTATPASNTSLSVNWSPNTANSDISGYKVYVGTSSGNYNLPGYAGGKNVGLATTETVPSLSANTPYYIAVTAVDAVKGESGFSFEIVATPLDTSPPALSIDPVATPTKNTAQTIAGTVTDNVAVASVTVQIGGNAAQPAQVAGSRWSFDASGLAAGANAVTVTAVDTAGNPATVSTSIFVDQTPPDLAINPVVTPTASTTQHLTGTASDNNGLASVTVKVGGAAALPATVTGAGWSFDISGLSAGSNTITATALDTAGNATTATTSIYLDQTAPVVSVTPVATPTKTVSQLISGSATDNYDLASVTVKVGSGTPQTAARSGSGWSYTIPALAPGANAITVTATDTAGNAASTATSIFLDQTAPTVDSFTFPPVANLLSVPIVTFNASDAVGVTGYQVTEGPTSPDPDGAGWLFPAPTSVTLSSTGVKTLYGWAKDAAGNVSASVSGSVATAGAVNNDGHVTIADAILALDYALGIATPTPEQKLRTDVAPVDTASSPHRPIPDGKLDVDDVVMMLRLAAGLSW